ncbi:hypothetical protein SCHPADRAFT_825698 [Schizopora paradoxa]|uniref:tRNA-splicing endonuclease subunit Sen54 N-terminal domain-containing protein n=1 Tax=Schizopora paradoxa TaxID=27342 RepID=A0A0H2RZ33_9AGAM|nr:hypothetical protein SCHPADRAFT_825698 [Schizopora paradoxa]
MDDNLELPTANVPHQTADDAEDDAESSDEDDGALDWTKLPSGSSSRPFIPKRGEKEYEPSGQSGTLLQQHRLERGRSAMFAALDVERTVSNKAVSYGLWDPSISRTLVVTAHGSHLMSMGHSAPVRITADAKGKEKMHAHVQLLPEEALYLIERGSMFCRKASSSDYSLAPEAFEQAIPMTLQEAYAEMIGKEDTTLERYLVFSYLKRLGYIVTRAQPPSEFYPKAQKSDLFLKAKTTPLISRLFHFVTRPLHSLFSSTLDWWKPLPLTGFFRRFTTTYSSMFARLRLFKLGFSLPLHRSPQQDEPDTPYKVFYNLYKPGVAFAKTNPRPPDFQIVVVNARTTPMPTLHELSNLFDELPELPLPGPRQRRSPGTASSTNIPSSSQGKNVTPETTASLSKRIQSWLFALFKIKTNSMKSSQPRPWRPNPFQVLKHGKKIIVVAAVDSGMISFYRFGQGVFEEWPMM